MGRNRPKGDTFTGTVFSENTTTRYQIDAYYMDSRGGPLTVTLDPYAKDGDQATIIDYGGAADVSNITIRTDPSLPSHRIVSQGSPVGSVTIDSKGGQYVLTFYQHLKQWLVSDVTSGSAGPSTDAYLQGGNAFGATAVLGTTDANTLHIITQSVLRAVFDLLGNFLPPSDNTGHIGLDATRWARVRAVTVTSGDIEMLDDAGHAHWVLKEGDGKIYAHDHRNGRTYELVMRDADDAPPTPFARSRHLAHIRLEKAARHATGHAEGVVRAHEELSSILEAAAQAGDPATVEHHVQGLRAKANEAFAELERLYDPASRPDAEAMAALDDLDIHGQRIQELVRHGYGLVARAHEVIEERRRAEEAERDRLLRARLDAERAEVHGVPEAPPAEEAPPPTEEPPQPPSPDVPAEDTPTTDALPEDDGDEQ